MYFGIACYTLISTVSAMSIFYCINDEYYPHIYLKMLTYRLIMCASQLIAAEKQAFTQLL